MPVIGLIVELQSLKTLFALRLHKLHVPLSSSHRLTSLNPQRINIMKIGDPLENSALKILSYRYM